MTHNNPFGRIGRKEETAFYKSFIFKLFLRLYRKLLKRSVSGMLLVAEREARKAYMKNEGYNPQAILVVVTGYGVDGRGYTKVLGPTGLHGAQRDKIAKVMLLNGIHVIDGGSIFERKEV